MPNSMLPSRPQITRLQLQQVFPNNPQVVLAFEQLLQAIGTPGSGAVNTTGNLMPFAGLEPPSGWLLCDGSAVGRLTYPNLFSVIGELWGAGDGQTTFNLPDLRGKALVGANETYPLGSSGGAETATLTVDNLPAHNHGVTDPGHAHAVTDPGHTHSAETSGTAELALDAGSQGMTAVAGSTGAAATGITISNAQTGVATQNTGQGKPISTLSPYAAVSWVIKT